MMNIPIRYFGGKGNGLREKIIEYFPDQSAYKIYLEPFGGGANLLFAKPPFGTEIYNDLEQNVYSLFKVLSDPKMFKEFKALCDLAIYSKRLWEEYKQDLKSDKLSLVERAYRYFYVNRTSVNGIGGFSIATVIRRNMAKSISDLLSTVDGLYAIHDRLSRVIVENSDGIELIKRFDGKDTFIYADPPYHWSTRTSARYKVDMTKEQQEQLIDTLVSLKHASVLLSGYDCDAYKRLEKRGWQRFDFDVNVVGGNRKPRQKTESLWRNYLPFKPVLEL